VRGNHDRPPICYLLKMMKIQESVNRRYLNAIKTLAQVRRKLQVNTPGVQFNTQINLGEPMRGAERYSERLHKHPEG
jgi:hypothetical protein